MTMSFDALTIAGILAAALSGGFVLAIATVQASKRSANRRSSSPLLAQEVRRRRRGIHARRRERTPLVSRRSRAFR
jgi:hypothetical protein